MARFTRRSLIAAIAASLPWLGLRRAFSSGWSESTSSPVLLNRPPIAPQSGLASAWFTDVAGRSSFPYRTNNDFSGRKYFPQPMCGGVAAIDYDNDGNMDLFFTNGAKLPELKKTTAAYFNCLLRNNGAELIEQADPVAPGMGGRSDA